MLSPLRITSDWIRFLQAHRRWVTLVASGCIIISYGIVFFIPKPVMLSYAGTTCTRQLTIAPQLHSYTGDNFTASFADQLGVGGLAFISLKTCFSPKTAPTEGTQIVATAPFGGSFARKSFAITTPAPPVASAASLAQPVPASQPLEITMNTPDALHRYELQVGKKTASCDASDNGVECDIAKLRLHQGKTYRVALSRRFAEADKTTVVTSAMTTLKAITIRKSSLKDKQTIFAKPRTFRFAIDKPLKAADVSLRANGKKSVVQTKTAIKGKKLIVTAVAQLDRRTDYKLVLKNVTARDGSTLLKPKTYHFTMSGGPKVASVSIGSSRVGVSQRVVVTFDQKISSSAAKSLRISGAKAAISASGKQASFRLQNLPRCQSFTLQVSPGLKSAYGIPATTGWQYKSRTICHTVIGYGSSVQGKSLTAYEFGSRGPVTMYVGAVHGNESSSSGLLQAWIDELERQPHLFKGRRIVVVPTINPDGVVAGSRTNARGVNLNRNFPTSNWSRDINDTDGKHKNGGGKTPLSEPEAAALARFTQQVRPRLLLSFHAVGSLVQGDTGSASARYAATYASMVGYTDATGNGGTFDYDITGGYEEWAYRNQGIPSMVVELGSYQGYFIDHHQAALWAMLQ